MDTYCLIRGLIQTLVRLAENLKVGGNLRLARTSELFEAFQRTEWRKLKTQLQVPSSFIIIMIIVLFPCHSVPGNLVLRPAS